MYDIQMFLIFYFYHDKNVLYAYVYFHRTILITIICYIYI